MIFDQYLAIYWLWKSYKITN